MCSSDLDQAATAQERTGRASELAPATKDVPKGATKEPATTQRPADEERPPGEDATASPRDALLPTTPRTASRRGQVVDGFPAAILRVLPDATVRSSGVSTSGGLVQVSLVATSGRAPARVMAAYRAMLAARGFVETPAPAVGGATASSFTRRRDSLTVTTTVTRSGTGYSVFGRLRPGATG